MLLVAFLLVPLALTWGRTGPPADRAFHLVMGYFRVRYERHADGHFSLTVTGRGGGVAVTVVVGAG